MTASSQCSVAVTVECDGRTYKTVVYTDDPRGELRRLGRLLSEDGNAISDTVEFVVSGEWPKR